MGVLEKMNLKQLQGLKLDDLLTLKRATGLTRLDLSCCEYEEVSNCVWGAKLVGALSQMARLEQLSLNMEMAGHDSYLEAIGLLTTLTKLTWQGGQVSTADVAEIARLTRLRVLSLVPGRRAPDGDDLDRCLALARLPQLIELHLGSNMGICRGDVTDEVATLMNATLHSSGCAPLRLHVS
jgi:hypothetical protein